jgi:hypothetical protein
MNEKAPKGRPRQVYEERDDGKNAERFNSVARHLFSVQYEAVKRLEKAPSKASAASASPVGKARKRR